MLVIKGPGGGLLPKYLEVVLNRKAKVNIQADTPIDWDKI